LVTQKKRENPLGGRRIPRRLSALATRGGGAKETGG